MEKRYNEQYDFHNTNNSHVWNVLKWKHAYNMNQWDFCDKGSAYHNRNRNKHNWKSYRQNQWVQND